MECCDSCKFFGRSIHSDRVPEVTCNYNPPGKYEVKERTRVGSGPMFTLTVIDSPFPGVNTGDYCGKYEYSPETEERVRQWWSLERIVNELANEYQATGE